MLGVVFKLNLEFCSFPFAPAFPQATNFIDLGNGINMKVDCPYETLLISQESRLGSAGLREGKITEGRALWRAVCVHMVDKY